MIPADRRIARLVTETQLNAAWEWLYGQLGEGATFEQMRARCERETRGARDVCTRAWAEAVLAELETMGR